MNAVDHDVKHKIIYVVKAVIPNAKMYLFGSRAHGTYRESSDIDIAIDAGKPVSRFVTAEISNMLNASRIPFHIDVVDVHSVEDEMKKAILQEGILWTE